MVEVVRILMKTEACPVQCDGELADGRPFYFRYRYAVATLAVGPDCDGVTTAREGVVVVRREFADRHPLDGSLSALEAFELIASMVTELPTVSDG